MSVSSRAVARPSFYVTRIPSIYKFTDDPAHADVTRMLGIKRNVTNVLGRRGPHGDGARCVMLLVVYGSGLLGLVEVARRNG